ncbi:MAG: four helix bundle protein, partial [Puniceicoccales bacterium]
YREAERSRTKKEFISTMGICLKELNESFYWLELIKVENLIEPKRLQPLINETSELIAIFTTILKKSQL